MMTMKSMRLLRSAGLFLAAALLSVSCHCDKSDDPEEYGKVMILYSAGFNNLSPNLARNVADLEAGYVPGRKDRDAILVVSRRTLNNNAGNFKDETAPCLFRLYKNKNVVVRDTLWSMPAGTPLSDPDVMKQFLLKIRDLFPAESYGMIFASHSTGWLPKGYYSNPSAYDDPSRSGRLGARKTAEPILAPFLDAEDGRPLTRSVGADYYLLNDSKKTYSRELDITEMTTAIPMHLDYLVFDSCLMGGIEVAYELKEVAEKIGFSQAEVLAEGLNYRTAAEHLLKGTPDPASVCKDYFEQYDRQSGVYHSATTSLVDCGRLEELAIVCKPLFARYGEALRVLDDRQVQGFGGAGKPWYFDLRDMLEQAGATAAELEGLDAALARCIIYKADTGQYYSMFEPGGIVKIRAFCGLSMYLPSTGSAYLDGFYRGLAWNKAAGLVR